MYQWYNAMQLRIIIINSKIQKSVDILLPIMIIFENETEVEIIIVN